LPQEIKQKDQLFICKYITPQVVSNIELDTVIEEELPEQTIFPNFDIDINNISTNTVDYKN